MPGKHWIFFKESQKYADASVSEQTSLNIVLLKDCSLTRYIFYSLLTSSDSKKPFFAEIFHSSFSGREAQIFPLKMWKYLKQIMLLCFCKIFLSTVAPFTN